VRESEIRIPFNQPSLAGREFDYMAESLARGHISGDGLFSRRCHELLERELGVRRALLTASGTGALEMAALLLGLGAGDEFIVPSFTFVSTANAFALRGARPVFADIRPDTLNLDERQLESLIGPRTKAVVVVHYAGVGCEMETILSIAARRGLPVIEDNAHGLFGMYRGRYLGTFGPLAAQSFHETKNFSCGEGGALVVNDPRYVGRAEVVREKGTDRKRFFRGEVDKYTWVDVGSSYLPSDLLAAFLYAQLEAREHIQTSRRLVWERYRRGLHGWAESVGARLPFVPPHCEQSWHMFYLLMPSPESRDALLAHLKSRGILAVFHYQPLHLSRMGGEFGARRGQCPVAEEASERIVRLPFYTALTPAEQGEVIAAVTDFKLQV
jgi:dTDP-4-amino-4,6-dideoxygalactose transaminase